ncbi:hypothetical protein [Haloferula sp. A504]|uniref:hypothetical protein n=1 Tax=Haloferula sp. A504 TaxID=3373601 RepID=UPI0031C199C0|nr:hypothetical protein [Verrucomicrobiaceae bacterium E54]
MTARTIPLLLFACASSALAGPSTPPATPDDAIARARASAEIAGRSLSKVQCWLHEKALPKIDPKTGLYISHTSGSGRYRSSLWNYDDAAADTYPFLFWAAWYTDREKIDGPILGVLEAEQRICNHLDRIPTAVNPATLEKQIRSKDDLIFAASEYVKDGLIAIVEVAGRDNPWFERMRAIEDDIWKHADVDTDYGKIPTGNLEANGEQIQALVRLFTATGEVKYLDWAERLADHYLLGGDFLPTRLRDHGCEIIGGLGLLFAVETVHRPEKAAAYRPHLRRMFDEILERGTNEDGMMFNALDQKKGPLSDGWGYNYVAYLCFDMATGETIYQPAVERTLANLSKPLYQDYRWEGNSIDGFADSIEGGLYLINRLPVPEAIAWADDQSAKHLVKVADEDHLWGTMKLESNGVRTVLQHAMMHTRGTTAHPWQQGLQLGASQQEDGLTVVVKSDKAWTGRLVFDKPRHRLGMGFSKDWPRMNTMPEWFTVEPDARYVVEDPATGQQATHPGTSLIEGLELTLEPGVERQLVIRKSAL